MENLPPTDAVPLRTCLPDTTSYNSKETKNLIFQELFTGYRHSLPGNVGLLLFLFLGNILKQGGPQLASFEFQNKLAVVFCTDVVGYSRLMGDDPEGTLQTLTEYQQIFFNKIKEHHGRVVNAPGDSILAEFASVLDAVSCAVAIQRELAERNSELPDVRRMDFRIGINLGDVLVKGDDLYGDGVNVASRLESLAEPGGICISEKAHREVKNRLPLHFVSMGAKWVKNIAEPVEAYRVLTKPGDAAHRVARARRGMAGNWIKTAVAAGLLLILAGGGYLGWVYFQDKSNLSMVARHAENVALPLPDKPSIVVLPFANLSGDVEQEYFADGITDDIITDLSKVGGLFVIARNTSFTYKGKNVNVKQVARDLGIRYVLEGSVRRAGNQVRINAQLIDAATDGHLWAERYDGGMDDIFALQDNITGRIVSALAVRLTAGEKRRVARTETASPEAYDSFLKGRAHYTRNTPGEFLKAIPFFTKALDHDPNFRRVHAALADLYSKGARYGWGRYMNLPFGESWQRAKKYLDEAMKDPVPLAHSVASYIHTGESRYQPAIEAAEQAIAMDSSDPVGYGAMASTLIRSGKSEKAVEYIEKAMRLDPKNREDYLVLLGLAQFGMEKFEKAAANLELATQARPDFEWGYLWLAASYGQLGEAAKAESAISTYNALREKAGFNWLNTLQGVEVLTFIERKDLELIREGLRVAGVPPGKPVPDADELIYQTEEGLAVKGATTIDAKRAKELFDQQGVVFVDVRNDVAWNKGHIPGAVHYEANKIFSRTALSKIASADREVVVYCAGPG